MKPLTLDEFIKLNARNAWVVEPGFSGLYVRRGQKYIDRRVVDNVLDIANVTAEEPGNGAFTKLIARLRAEYPGMSIFIENVIPVRFALKLDAMGFTRIPSLDPVPVSFYLLA